jgi:hypothetical protein
MTTTTRTMTVTAWYTSNDQVENLLDTMIDAQNRNGRITWTNIRETHAAGYVGGDQGSRVVVIDVDSSDGADIVALTLWAGGAEAIQPDIDLP